MEVNDAGKLLVTSQLPTKPFVETKKKTFENFRNYVYSKGSRTVIFCI